VNTSAKSTSEKYTGLSIEEKRHLAALWRNRSLSRFWQNSNGHMRVVSAPKELRAGIYLKASTSIVFE
jgi:hypothetical protein